MKNKTYFVSGIDTNVGKTIVTGIIAKEFMNQGVNIITQKMIQTGNVGYSEDIEAHRQLMGMEMTDADKSLLTAPCIRSYPCSPHLAARLDNEPIDINKIDEATKKLEEEYELVLLEGAGGIMVPITEDYLTIDFVAERDYPIILVTSGKLGSLNHTLLTLEAIKSRNLKLHSLIYNRYPAVDETIESDSLIFLQNWLTRHFSGSEFRVIENQK